MVAALIASGASAGAVTDPNSQNPNDRTPASIAATCGHAGIAGYISEVALISHLSSIFLEESELSKGSAAVEAERSVNSSSKASSSKNEDRVFAAVRNAAQAAACIQSTILLLCQFRRNIEAGKVRRTSLRCARKLSRYRLIRMDGLVKEWNLNLFLCLQALDDG